jgi:hypothetical protein
MNCQEFWNSMPEPAAHPHLQSCAGCARRMQRRRELAAGLSALASGMRRVGAPARVEERLTAAFRAHGGVVHSGRPSRRWIPALTWGVALAATIGAGLFLIGQRQPEAQRPAPVRWAELAAMRGPSAADLEAASEEGFLPLPGAVHLPAAEEYTVLHMELPRSSMLSVGIDIAPDQADETVRADVMIGGDGLARAVRFENLSGSD